MDANRKLVQGSDTREPIEPMPKITNLQRRGRRYWMRLMVPHALRSIIGKSEILASLNTTDLVTAKQRLTFEVAKAHAIMRDAQRKLEASTVNNGIATITDPEWINAMRWLQRNATIVPSPQARIAEPLRALTELENEFGQDTVRLEVEKWLEGHRHLTTTGTLIKFSVPAKKRAPTFEEVIRRFRSHQKQGKSPKTLASENTQDAVFIQII